MARARNIKPGFFINEDLCDLSPLARLLFIGLWTIADREGRLEDRPKRIRMAILPADDCDVAALLEQLDARGFIVRYAGESCGLIQIANWAKHQRPHHTERASTLPGPTVAAKALRKQQLSQVTVNDPGRNGGNPPDSLIHRFTDSLIPEEQHMSRSAEKPADRDPSLSLLVAEVFEHWRATMRKPRAALDDKRRKVIRAALANGYTVGDLRKAIDGCALSAWHMGQNDRGATYNALELILRNAEKIDAFMTMADTPPALNRTPTRDEQRADFIAQLTGRAPKNDDKGAGYDPFTIDV